MLHDEGFCYIPAFHPGLRFPLANPQHTQWLLEGVQSWNKRREQQHFEPDLRDATVSEEFIASGIIKRGDEIPLAGINLNHAKCRDADFGTPSMAGANLRKANLRDADFRNVDLVYAKLDGADLRNASFDGADMGGSSLRGANLEFTSFREANLLEADLSEAQCRYTDFKQSTLACAILEKADLSKSKLNETDLGWSRPWLAKLFPETGASLGGVVENSEPQNIHCIADLVQQCAHLKSFFRDYVVYFRGEETAEFELRPSIMRKSDSGKFIFRDSEGEMLLELMSRRPEDFNGVNYALAQWVLGQHHGLKTRLLDVTRNPLVGLFWACNHAEAVGRLHVFCVPRQLVKHFNSDTVSVIANFAKLPRSEQDLIVGRGAGEIAEREVEVTFAYEKAMDRLYYLIRAEKPFFRERIDFRDLFRVLVVEPQKSFERIRTQAGAFLVSAFHERFERKAVLNWNRDIPIYEHLEFFVPSESKNRILEELLMLNITRETLFPGLDEAAQAITRASASNH